MPEARTYMSKRRVLAAFMVAIGIVYAALPLMEPSGLRFFVQFILLLMITVIVIALIIL